MMACLWLVIKCDSCFYNRVVRVGVLSLELATACKNMEKDGSLTLLV